MSKYVLGLLMFFSMIGTAIANTAVSAAVAAANAANVAAMNARTVVIVTTAPITTSGTWNISVQEAIGIAGIIAVLIGIVFMFFDTRR